MGSSTGRGGSSTSSGRSLVYLDGPGRERGKGPTAADADVDNHIDAPAHNAISLETEVIHEGKDAHA